VGRDGGDLGNDAEAGVDELAQLLHHCVDPLGTRSLWIKNGFGVVEDYEHFI